MDMRSPRLGAQFGAIAVALVAIVALLDGCGSGASGGTWASAARIHVYTASVHVPSNKPGVTATASCHPGEQMVGGGYAATDIFEYDASVAASYPSSGDSWTAVSGSSAFYTLTAEVYCLPGQPNIGAGVTLDEQGSGHCASGGVALSLGFNGAARYVICATKHVRAAPTVHSTFNPMSSSHSYEAAQTSLTCPAGQAATGGWVAGPEMALASHSAGAPYATWTFTLGGDGDIALSVICVTFQVT